MKKVLLTLLGVIVVVGILAGAGFAGYRLGYMHGATASADGTVTFVPRLMPMHSFDQGFGPQNMPLHNFGRGNERSFNHGFGPGGFGMMGRSMHGGGFGLFSLLHLAFWGIVIWLAYKWFKNSGWTLTRQAVASPKAETASTEKTE
jgi:hypothetical protein